MDAEREASDYSGPGSCRCSCHYVDNSDADSDCECDDAKLDDFEYIVTTGTKRSGLQRRKSRSRMSIRKRFYFAKPSECVLKVAGLYSSPAPCVLRK